MNTSLTGKILLRVVSSVLHNGLHINTLISCCRETSAGTAGARGGGGTWLGIRSQYWTFKENVLFCWNVRDGRF
jgi:hypothetical protein